LVVFTPPAKAVVESKDMARREKMIFFILLILNFDIMILAGRKIYACGGCQQSERPGTSRLSLKRKVFILFKGILPGTISPVCKK
jgi:hypothetical protein